MPTDADIRQAAGRLRSVMAWAKDKLADYHDIVPKQEEVVARYQLVFAPDNIPSLTEEEFGGFLRFENNRHWWFPPFHVPSICQDMALLREALGILVDESRPIGERLDELLPKSGSPMVPYLGRAIITAILLIVAPDKYGVWNSRSEGGLKELGVFPESERGAPFSNRYVAFNTVLKRLAEELGADLWTLDFLLYALAKYDEDASPQRVAGTQGPEPGREEPGSDLRFELEQYLHEFMRDNWDKLPLSEDWSLHEEDGELVGFEYSTGGVGYIDLLAHHKTEQRWLVIELKRNQTSDATVGQVLRYMGWVKEHLANEGDATEGLIIAHTSDDRIRYALEYTHNIRLKLYEIDFQLNDPHNGGVTS